MYKYLMLFCVTLLCVVNVYQFEIRKQLYKNELAELLKVKYGLLNIDEWEETLTHILSKKVDELNFDDQSREKMHQKISVFLFEVIGQLENRYYEEKSESLIGLVQGSVAAITGTFKQIKKDIPIFTDKILDFLNEEENREGIKSFLVKKLQQYREETFAATDYSRVEQIIAKYEMNNRKEAIAQLKYQIDTVEGQALPYKIGSLVSFLFLTTFTIMMKSLQKVELLLVTCSAILLLVLGVFLPMIAIDARISALSFQLLGEQVQFVDQILFYKSKSILSVVQLMVLRGGIGLSVVGAAIFAFSVLFPMTKMLCTILYIIFPKLRGTPLVTFMVHRIGKWSMADVTVVAIFMAFIGFDGVISEQLAQLESTTVAIDLLTTNQSDVQFGFYSFFAFVLLGLIISTKLDQLSHKS